MMLSPFSKKIIPEWILRFALIASLMALVPWMGGVLVDTSQRSVALIVKEHFGFRNIVTFQATTASSHVNFLPFSEGQARYVVVGYAQGSGFYFFQPSRRQEKADREELPDESGLN